MRYGWLALLLVLSLPLAARCPVPENIVPVAAATDAELAIATQNLWRLMESGVAPVQQQERINAWARHLRDVLRYPHLLVVQEVENQALLERLAAAVRANEGPQYHVHLIEGNDSSGIDVAVLSRAPIETGKVSALFATDRQGRHWLFSRPPLKVEIVAPIPFQLVALHLRSGHGLDSTRDGPRVRATREAQARQIRRWAEGRMAEGTPLLLAGDFNSAPVDGDYGVPLRILDQPPLWSAWQKVPPTERFSYIYRCQRQAIDHLLLSPKLVPRVSRAAVTRGNAGRYRTLHGSGGLGEVVSDHDALVVYLKHHAE